MTYELAVRRQSEEDERKEITRSDSIEDIIEKITYKNIISLEEHENHSGPGYSPKVCGSSAQLQDGAAVWHGGVPVRG